MRKWLIERNIGYDFITKKSKIPRLKENKLKQVYKASVLLNNLGDISKIDSKDIPNFDLFNFSFCCQDIPISGKQKGMVNKDGSHTRSGLYIYGINIIRDKKPKYIMIENVKNLISKKFIHDFYDIINELEDIGYNCYYPKKGNGSPKCLNAKDYGVPQNRERIYVICIRKDIDNGKFTFPKGFDKGVRLKDILENNVDEKYYLSEEIQKRFKQNYKDNGEHNIIGSTATDYKQPKQILDKNNCINIIGLLNIKGNEQVRRVYGTNGVSPTLSTMQGGNRQPKIVDINKIQYKIRKLTPVECWKLMGFTKEDCLKAKEQGISDSQLYKQAGNSIVVNVLEYIFKNLFYK